MSDRQVSFPQTRGDRTSGEQTPLTLLPSHRCGSRASKFGWAGSTAIAALLVSALGAWALSLQEPGTSLGESPVPIMMMTADVPSVEAMREPTPDVVDQAAQAENESPDIEDAPDEPDLAEAPDLPEETPDLIEDLAEAEPEVDTKAPPSPIVEKPKPKKPKVEKKERKKEKPVEQAEAKPKKKKRSEAQAESKASKSSASAASSGAGSKAAADYGSKVMNKVNRTRKKNAGDKGKVVVSFKVAESGGLASVSVAVSSGSAKLDQVALDHVRRAAPFPPPPPGAQRSFRFNFIGK